MGEGTNLLRLGAESQWIVAARPLCHVQYPVANLSRLQRILPIIRSKLQLKASARVMYKTRAERTYITRPWELEALLLDMGRMKGSGAAFLAWILT